MARLLLIDDDDAFRTMLRRTLERAGHTVTEAEEGGAGLRALATVPIDLVITDIIMPGMEGLQTIQEIRRARPGLKIIAISGGGRQHPESYLKVAQAFGAVCVLSKPFDNQTLFTAIDAALREASSG